MGNLWGFLAMGGGYAEGPGNSLAGVFSSAIPPMGGIRGGAGSVFAVRGIAGCGGVRFDGFVD